LKEYFEKRKWIHDLDYDDIEEEKLSPKRNSSQYKLQDSTSEEFKSDFKKLKEDKKTLQKENQLLQQRVDKLLASLTILEKMQQNIDETHSPCSFKVSPSNYSFISSDEEEEPTHPKKRLPNISCKKKIG